MHLHSSWQRLGSVPKRAPQGGWPSREVHSCLPQPLPPACKMGMMVWGSRGHLGAWVTLRKEPQSGWWTRKNLGLWAIAALEWPPPDFTRDILLFKSLLLCGCCSVAKSCPTLWPHGLQHSRLLCPSPSLGVCSNSCPLCWWCHPIISSSVSPCFSCPQSCLASGSFPIGPNLMVTYWPLGLFCMLRRPFKGKTNLLSRQTNFALVDLEGQVNNL